MGAPNPATSEAVQSLRQEERPMGEELNEEIRIVQNPGKGDSKAINITKYATDTLDIETGDRLTVKTYRNRIVLEPEGGNE